MAAHERPTVILMAINSNVPNALAVEALASGGLRAPLKGQDVLDVDPSQLDLNALPDSEIDLIEPLTQPDTELLAERNSLSFLTKLRHLQGSSNAGAL